MLISLDTETTGLDLYHGARPFFVTSCDEEGNVRFWEWDVDPNTREVLFMDRDEIKELIEEADEIVLQNGKFDAKALATLDIALPLEKMQDTLIAGHILNSEPPHDLYSMVKAEFGEDLSHHETALKDAVQQARRMVKSKEFIAQHGEWLLAKEGLACMPSAKAESKEKTAKGLPKSSPWGFDMWLPRAVAKLKDWESPDRDCEHAWVDSSDMCQTCGGHFWWIALQQYSNADSVSTLALWKRQREALERLDLWDIYKFKMLLPPVLLEMEDRGLSLSKSRLIELRDEYRGQIIESESICVNIAASYQVPKAGSLFDEMEPFQLTLPKSGNNKSLTTFAFEVMQLPVIATTETGKPALDKDALAAYLTQLPSGSKQRLLIKHLARSRKRTKAIEYLDAYEKFWIADDEEWHRLHASVNSTGTGTTRFSMSNPNLQQVSKQETQCQRCEGDGCSECGGTGEDLHSVRRVFGPAPGREWWSADAKNIELRIPAFESSEPSLVALFEHPDDPPFYGSQHLLNFSVVYPDVWAKEMEAVGFKKVGPHCKKKYASTFYQWTKNGGLGMQYRSGRATADATFRRLGSYDRLKSSTPLLEAHNDRMVQHARRHGWVETIPSKKVCPRRGYPLRCGRYEDGNIRGTVPLNYRTQGSAGFWMWEAMVACHAQLMEWRHDSLGEWDGYIALTVHDELVFDFPAAASPVDDPENSNLWRMRELQALMESGGDSIGVPTPVSVEWHPVSWAEGITL